MFRMEELQWVVTIGRCKAITMYSFCIASKQYHLACLKRIFGYFRANTDGCIRFRVGLPDYSHLKQKNHDWMSTVHRNVKEADLGDIPRPLRPTILTTTNKDASLLQDLTTRSSARRILHFLNQTLIERFSKRQDTSEVATYGSNFIAAWKATDPIINLKTMLRYIGGTILHKFNMFGDNQAVIRLPTFFELPLHKRHNILACHHVRKAVALKMLQLKFVKSCDNATNILSNNVPNSQA